MTKSLIVGGIDCRDLPLSLAKEIAEQAVANEALAAAEAENRLTALFEQYDYVVMPGFVVETKEVVYVL